MPFAVGRHRRSRCRCPPSSARRPCGPCARLRAGGHRVSPYQVDARFSSARRFVRLGELHEVAQASGERRRDRRAALQHRVDAFIVDDRRRERSGQRQRARAYSTASRPIAWTTDLAVRAAGSRAPYGDGLPGERGNQGAVGTALDAVERDLHAVDAVLGLDADLLDRFVPVGDQPPDRRSTGAPIQVGYQSTRLWRRRDAGPGAR